jgi:hypothetical protein
MTGDQADIAARLRRLLPNWFGQDVGPTPVLDALLEGPAWAMSFIYSLIAYARLQTRLLTMTDGWLDMAAEDFFGDTLRRKATEEDDLYRTRIRSALFAPSNTRAAISEAVQAIAGVAPRIIEPWRPDETGTWDGGPCAMYWDVDNTATPFRWTTGGGQFFLEVPISPQSVIGWGALSAWDARASWDTYSFAFHDISTAQIAAASEILAQVKKIKAEGVLALIRFTGLPGAGYAPRWDVDGYAWDTGSPPRWDSLPAA